MYLKINSKNNVLSFNEKNKTLNTWINAGFFIFKQEIFKFIKDKNSIFKKNLYII